MNMLNFYKEILKAISSNDLQTVISTAHELLGYPIVVINRGWFVMANAPDEKIGDPYWDAQQKFRYTPNNLVMSCYRNGYMEVVNSSGNAIILDWGNVKYPHVGTAIVKNDVIVGYLSIYYTDDRIPIEYIVDATNILGNVISIFFNNDTEDNSKADYAQKLFIQSLFEGKHFSQQEIDDWISLTKINLVGKYAIFALKNTASDSAMVNYLDTRMRSLQPNWIVYRNSDLCYMLSFGIKNSEMFSNIKNIVAEQLSSIPINCGYSCIFSDLAELTKYMFQARKAMEFAHVLDQDSPICGYNDIRDMVSLSYALAKMDRKNYMHPLLIDLEEYDRLYNTQYFETLQVYLYNICNSHATTEQLNIHRNTLLYRLNKISEICECDLNDINLCRQLMLSVQMQSLDGKLQMSKFSLD